MYELGINTTFTFYVQDEEASGALQVDQLKDIKNLFLSDMKEHLEAELETYDAEVVIIETTPVSMEGLAENEPHFKINTTIRFRSNELGTPGALDYLKDKLKHWTRIIGDRLQSNTDSGHYVSGVTIAFPQDGGRRKKSKKRRSRRRLTR